MTIDRVALRRVHAGGDGDLVAEIARQADIAEARVALGERLQHDGAGIAAAVVDEDRLRRSVKPGEQQVEPAQQHRQNGFLVEYRDDDAVADRLGIVRHLRGFPPSNGRKSRTPIVKAAFLQPLRGALFRTVFADPAVDKVNRSAAGQATFSTMKLLGRAADLVENKARGPVQFLQQVWQRVHHARPEHIEIVVIPIPVRTKGGMPDGAWPAAIALSTRIGIGPP